MTFQRLVSLLVLVLTLAACRTAGADTPVAVTPELPTVAASATTAPSATSVPASPTVAATETELVVAVENSPTATQSATTVATATATASPEPSPSATVAATATTAPSATVAASATPDGPELPDEVIAILEPGPGSRVVGAVRVAGEADGTFEQNLVVRLVTADGVELALEPTTIQADLGMRGPFEIEIPFTVAAEENAFIQVFAQSPRDGGITHLSSVGVRLAPNGAEEIVPVTAGLERIAIFEPATGDVIRGGVAHIEGFALASFEQSLMVDIVDSDGNYVGQESITVDAPDLGQPGPFSADIPYEVESEGPGRIVVRDPSQAFNGTVHLSSVEVTLGP